MGNSNACKTYKTNQGQENKPHLSYKQQKGKQLVIWRSLNLNIKQNNKCQCQCQCFQIDQNVRSVLIKRQKEMIWRWTARHSLLLLTNSTISEIDDIIPIEIIDTIKTFADGDRDCVYLGWQICDEYRYSDIKSLIKKKLCKQWYLSRYDDMSKLLLLNIVFLAKGDANKIIREFSNDLDIPELQPSYLYERELRRTIDINGCKIRLDILDATHQDNYHEIVTTATSQTVYVIMMEEMNQLNETQKICQKILYMNKHLKNCILLYMNKGNQLNALNQEKIKMWSQNWNIPYIDKHFYTTNEIFLFFVKHWWFNHVD